MCVCACVYACVRICTYIPAGTCITSPISHVNPAPGPMFFAILRHLRLRPPCITRLIHTRDMIPSYLSMVQLIHREIGGSHVTCISQLIHREIGGSHGTCTILLIHREIGGSHVTCTILLIHRWYNSYIHMTWLPPISQLIHRWYNSYIDDTTHTHTWHDSLLSLYAWVISGMETCGASVHIHQPFTFTFPVSNPIFGSISTK